MTRETCLKLLELYKEQMENPVAEPGNPASQPLHGDQAKHAIARSKINYRNMAMNILSSRKFNGGEIEVRVRGGKSVKKFDKHPIVDELKKEFGLLEEKPKKEVKKEEPKKEKEEEDGKK